MEWLGSTVSSYWYGEAPTRFHEIINNQKGDRNWLDVEMQPRHHHSDQ